MSIETTVQLSGSCKIVATEYEHAKIGNMIEHSSDHCHSDNETSIDISKESKELAIEMIAMFQKHLNI
jgi:hypothetical protein